MKARIGVASEDLIRRHMISVAAGNISHNKHLPTFWFTSLNEASKLLCNENIELMLLINREKPESLAELVEIRGHHIRELSRTLTNSRRLIIKRIHPVRGKRQRLPPYCCIY